MFKPKATILILSSLTIGTFIGTVLGLQWTGKIAINTNWMLGLEIVALIAIMLLVTIAAKN